MGRLTAAELAKVAELSRELGTMRLDTNDSIAALLPELRRFLELEVFLVFVPEERLTGLGIARLEADHLPRSVASAFATFLESAPRRCWFFDPVAPDAPDRDRVVDTVEHVGESTYRTSAVFRHVWQRLRFTAHRELRLLVCRQTQLLGWVGGFMDGAIEQRQQQRLAALLPSLRRRLAVEHQLRSRHVVDATLQAALEQIDGAAFVIGPRNSLALMNRTARNRLDHDPERALWLLTDLGTPRDGREVLSLRAAGMADHTLVLLRCNVVANRARCAADRWELTPRQRDVFRLLIGGSSNAQIAESLGISERGVEFHVTSIFDRARVSSRAALISRAVDCSTTADR